MARFRGGDNRTFYLSSLGVFTDPTKTAMVLGATDGISVHRGSFRTNRLNWEGPVLIQPPNYPNDFLDKPALAAGKRNNAGKVYVTATNFKEVDGFPIAGAGQIELYRSMDSGKTWSGPTVVQPDETVSLIPEIIGRINQGSMPVVGPDGEVYVAWERGWLGGLEFPGFLTYLGPPEIRIARSDDDGATFGPSVLVSEISSTGFFPPFGQLASFNNDFPRLAVALEGQHRGRLYVTWNDSRVANGGTQGETGGIGHPDGDIYVSYSDDRGATWASPILVAGGPNWQFFPVVSVETSGDVQVVYYEQQAFTGFVDVFWAESTDGGATFGPPVKVTSVTSDWFLTFSYIIPSFGDYIGAVSLDEKLLVTWCDGRANVADAFFAKIRTGAK